jgi:hypothetical protein
MWIGIDINKLMQKENNLCKVCNKNQSNECKKYNARWKMLKKRKEKKGLSIKAPLGETTRSRVPWHSLALLSIASCLLLYLAVYMGLHVVKFKHHQTANFWIFEI